MTRNVDGEGTPETPAPEPAWPPASPRASPSGPALPHRRQRPDGARTQLSGLLGAAAIALVLLFLTEPMQYLPKAALGAVIVAAAIGRSTGGPGRAWPGPAGSRSPSPP